MSEVVKITEAAAKKALLLLAMAQKENNEEKLEGLRLAVVGGGCSGLSYKLGFDSLSEDGMDFESEAFGLRVFVDPKSAVLLQGTTVDYTEGLQNAGFKISNPNQKQGCGCGKSFSA